MADASHSKPPAPASSVRALPPIVLASFATAAVTYPADLVKALRMGAPAAAPIGELVGQFRQTYGIRGFFTQGVAPEVARAGLMRTFKFFFFPVVCEAMWGRPPSECGGFEKAAAAIFAACPETIFIMPLEMGKLGLQLDRANEFGGSSRAAMARVARDRGVVRGLYAGYLGVQWRQSSWSAVYFSTVDGIEAALNRAVGGGGGDGSSFLVKLASGFVAGCGGAAANVPGDLVRTKIQRDAFYAGGKPGPIPFFAVSEFLAVGAGIARAGGVASLWTGFRYKALHLGGSGALMACLLPTLRQLLMWSEGAVSRKSLKSLERFAEIVGNPSNEIQIRPRSCAHDEGVF